MSRERLSIFEGLVALESVLRVEAQERFIGVSVVAGGALRRYVRIEIADSPVHGWSKEKQQAWRSFVTTMPIEPARHRHAHRVVPEHRFGLQARRELESSITRSVPSFVPDEHIGDVPPASEGPATLRIDRTECAVWPNKPEAPAIPADRSFDLRGAGEIHDREGWPAPLLALARAPSDPAARAWVRDAAHVFEAPVSPRERSRRSRLSMTRKDAPASSSATLARIHFRSSVHRSCFRRGFRRSSGAVGASRPPSYPRRSGGSKATRAWPSSPPGSARASPWLPASR